MKTRKLVLWGLLLLLAVSLAGCIKGTDPETGKPTWKVDPNAVAKVEKQVDAAAVILQILSALWPVLIPVATGVGGALAVWHNVKPKLTDAQTEAKLYHTLGQATILGIDKFKELHPKEWSDLMGNLEIIKDKIISPDDRLKIDNLILALRGKPPVG